MFPDVFLAFLGKPLAELLGIDPNDFSKFRLKDALFLGEEAYPFEQLHCAGESFFV